MGKVRVNINGPVTKESVDLDFHTQDESKEITNAVTGVLGEGQGILKEDELQVTENVQLVNDAQTEAVQAQSGQQSSEQLQDPSLFWEGFLPTKSLKVMVVEDDDSTRLVICALLRKCGYEVTSIASGLQAWNILKDHKIHVDLVLTEVVMPGPSGIDLLSKMMSHRTCKDIPVIMMSSNDSLSMVFKCLSKGAVDFLVKPIRKNELKNLWQHAWRKCRSSSGSASENGVQTQKDTSTSVEESDKNTGSNHDDDIEIIGVNARDESDKGSGTEITQVIIRSSPEAFGNDLVPAITTRECEGQNEELGADITGTDLRMGVPKIPNLRLEEPKEKGLTNIAVTNKEKLSKMNDKLQKGQVELNNEKPNEHLKNQAGDLMGVTTNSTIDPQMQSVMFNIPNSVSKVLGIRDKDINDSKEIPSLELSLKTQTDALDTGFSLKTQSDALDTGFSVHDRNAPRHLDLSSLSRYNFCTTSNQTGTASVVRHSSLHDSSEEEKAKSLPIFQCNSNITPLYHSNDFSNNNGMDSTTIDFLAKQKAFEAKPDPKSTIKHLQSSSAFQPDRDILLSLSHPIIQVKADAAFGNTILAQGRGLNQEVQVKHHHHHHVHDVPQHQQIPNHDELSEKDVAAEAPQCGPSDVLGALIEGNVGNHSLHSSDSGINHSSNEQNMSSSPINSGGSKEGTSSPIGVGSKSGVEQNHVSQREVALNKFHQKRKERCFEKKVRYQSRKKLAAQRPHVRGKFVQQEEHENKGKDTHC